MKDTGSSEVLVQGNIQGEAIDMGIAADATAHVMSLLTNAYGDPEMAVIREYATNGHDAHIEAGVDRAIEVTVPTVDTDAPLTGAAALRIRDYGTGLNREDIREIYSQYGASTKRQTNTQVGMLGIGCKAALAYGPSFTVIGIKDGIRTVVQVSRAEDGGGTMTVLEESQTDEDQGVEIMVPVKRFHRFEKKARRLFRFWPAGTVLVNGEEPSRVDGVWVTDSLLVTKEVSGDTIVMGNVPYPTDLDLGLAADYNIVAFVGIGAVNFPPSREALRDTPATKQTITALKAEFEANIKGAVKRSVDAAETPREALRRVIHWRGAVTAEHRPKDGEYTYRGRVIPASYDVQPRRKDFPEGEAGDQQHRAAMLQVRRITTTGRYQGTLSRSRDEWALSVETWPGAIWVHGYDAAKFTAPMKKKLNQWAEREGVEGQTYVLVDTLPPDADVWIDPKQVIDWPTIKAEKLPRAYSSSRSYKAIPGSYDTYTRPEGDSEYLYSHEVPANDLAGEGHLFYFIAHDQYDYVRAYARVIFARYPDAKVVSFNAAREAKFVRTFPQAQDVHKAAERIARRWWKGISDRTKLALAVAECDYAEELARVDHRKVSDPRLAELAKLARRDLTRVKESCKLYGKVTALENPHSIEDPFEGYPLLDGQSFNRRTMAHIYLYANAVYAANQKGA